MKKTTLSLLSCLALSVPSLSACSAAMLLEEAGDYIMIGDVNLKEKNYIAADYLAGLTHATLNKRTVIVPETLMHANNTGMTSAFGDVVVEQVSARFAQLGYTVYMPEKAENGDNKQMPAKGVSLGGTYLPNGSLANVSLRLVDRSTGQILGAYDYTLPVNNEVEELMEPAPRAFRITE